MKFKICIIFFIYTYNILGSEHNPVQDYNSTALSEDEIFRIVYTMGYAKILDQNKYFHRRGLKSIRAGLEYHYRDYQFGPIYNVLANITKQHRRKPPLFLCTEISQEKILDEVSNLKTAVDNQLKIDAKQYLRESVEANKLLPILLSKVKNYDK